MTVGRGVRRGAYMSTKVLARAACEGRCLSFMIPGLPGVAGTVDGYLVGMDDFHLQIAEVSDSDVTVALIHKSVPLIALSNDAFLSKEDENAQSAVKEIGSAFWKYCSEIHLGKNGNKESQ
jgi:hypothetical protein